MMQKAKNKNPKLFELDSDCKPTTEDIDLIEEYYNIVFPTSYKEFLLQYGGGYFAYTVVYFLDSYGSFYAKNNVSIEFINNNNFFPVIDFETGDLAGFKIDNGICKDTIVLYSHEEKIMSDTKLNFYNVLRKYGLELS
ncbi:MAG TPA: SMI1/KNR4 family protein [Candidatus Coprocola pullicola]|nr:SMI1/KNR4 family protein [Candidatus Coprocola pullicola]